MCQAAGVTPAQVADRLGINKSTVYMWKKQGTTPKTETLKKIARFFHATEDYLLEKDDFPYPDLSGQTMTFRTTNAEEVDTVKKLMLSIQRLSDSEQKAILQLIESFGKTPVPDSKIDPTDIPPDGKEDK